MERVNPGEYLTRSGSGELDLFKNMDLKSEDSSVQLMDKDAIDSKDGDLLVDSNTFEDMVKRYTDGNGNSTDQRTGATRGLGGVSIGEQGYSPTSKTERVKNDFEVHIAALDKDDTEEGQNRFFNAIDYSWDSTKANYYSLIGDDKTAAEVMAQSEKENADRGGVAGFVGGAITGILPTVVASTSALFAAPVVALGASATAMAYYITSSMGQAQREIAEYEKRTGKDVSTGMEITKTIGYGASAMVFEMLGIGSANKAARALGARNLIKIGKLFAEKEYGQASKIILKEFPKTFHHAGLAEGAEEGLEQIANNALTKLYDAQMTVGDGLLEAIGTGYFAGGLVGGSLQSVSGLSGQALAQANTDLEMWVNEKAEMVSKDIIKLKGDMYEGPQTILQPDGVFREMTEISPIVYNGSPEKFEKFDASTLGKHTGAASSEEGFFFATNPKIAFTYSGTKNKIFEAWQKRVKKARKKYENLTKKYGVVFSYVENRKRSQNSKIKGLTTSDLTSSQEKEMADAYEAYREVQLNNPIVTEESLVIDKEKQKYGALLEEHGALLERAKEIQNAKGVISKSYVSKINENSILQERLKVQIDSQATKIGKLENTYNFKNSEIGDGQLKAFHLKMNNPFIYDQEGKPYRETSYYNIIEEAKKKGHDGVIIKNTFDSKDKYIADEKTDIHIVFKPEQVQEVTTPVRSYVHYVDTPAPRLNYDLTNVEAESQTTETIAGNPEELTPLGTPLIRFQTDSQLLEQEKLKLEEALKSETGSNTVLTDDPELEKDFREQKLRGLKVIAAKMWQPFKVLGKAVYMEKAWIEHPKTGRAIQNLFSKRVAYQNEGDFVIRQIAVETEGTKDFDNIKVQISILANDAGHENSEEFQALDTADKERVRSGSRILRSYFDKYAEILTEKGILTDGYYEKYLNILESKMEYLKENDKTDEYNKLKDLVKRIESDLKFVHIPYNLLYVDGWMTEPNTVRKLKYLARQGRKNLTIQDIFNPVIDEKGNVIHEGFADKSVLSFANVIGSYSDRVGKDIGLQELMETAEGEGLIKNVQRINDKKKYDNGFTTPPSLANNLLRGKQISKVLAGWINKNTLYQYNPNVFLKVLNYAKMATFLSPGFLFMYDLVQGAYAGTISYDTIFDIKAAKRNKSIKAGFKESPSARAWRSLSGYSEEMLEAQKHGLEANILADSFVKRIEKSVGYGHANGTLQGKMRQYYHQFLKANGDLTGLARVGDLAVINPIKSVYQSTFSVAWFLDSFARRMSFYSLRDQGFSVKEAAEEAALIHGSYSSVNQKTRRTANIFLYTPTLKLVMGKYFARMTSDIIKGTKDYGEPAQRALEVMFRLLILAAGQSALMGLLGFDEKEFGRSYTRIVRDNTGQEKQLNIVWSAPNQMFLKYGYRGLNAGKSENGSGIVKFFKANVWELNPIWRVGYQVLIANRNPQTGDAIYNKSDDFFTQQISKSKAIIKYLMPSTLQKNDKNDLNYLNKKFNKRDLAMIKTFTSVPLNFLYMSKPESMKVIDRINAVTSKIGKYEPYNANEMAYLSPIERNKALKVSNELRNKRIANDLKHLDDLITELEILQRKEKDNFKKNKK